MQRLFVLALLVHPSDALRPQLSRRAAVMAAAASTAPAAVANAARRDELLGGMGNGCTYGEGDRCEELAEGNPLILKLQAQSRANKVKNEQELYDKTLAMAGYDDFFSTIDKMLVRKEDGSFITLTPAEYVQAKKAGKIVIGGVGGDVDILKD